MNTMCLRAISYARDYSEFQRARDLLAEFCPRTRLDEQEADHAARRIAELEELAALASVGAA